MKVWYMNGAGNDFMVIDARGRQIDFSPLALELCKLTDADGFMAVDDSEIADFKLHFYNSDGSRGEMCGNGSRCICRFAYENGIAGEAMTVETDAGLVSGARLSENRYRVRLNNPSILDLNRKGSIAYVELGDPGVPHAVMEVPGLRWEMGDALRHQARQLRFDPAFPKGANVNLYTWLDETTVRILTFERGVEDYTLACGTGSASTAVTLWAQGKLPGGRLTVKNRGGDLTVTVAGQNGRVDTLLLEGPTEIVKIFDL
ncbi:MAG: diaminopimelate epimerase [Oscillospiraceae bacterium]|nr:diaminopimelate epimerase [Oscillospiraceae bacterium]